MLGSVVDMTGRAEDRRKKGMQMLCGASNFMRGFQPSNMPKQPGR